MRNAFTRKITELYTDQPFLATEAQRLNELLCAAPGLNLFEASAHLGLPIARVRVLSAQLGLGTFRNRVKRGGGLAADPQAYSTGVTRRGIFPRRAGQVVEIDTTTVGVMVSEGSAVKLIATVACDSLTRSVVAVPGSDPSSFVAAIQKIEALAGPPELLLCDRRDGIPDTLRVSTGIPVRAVERIQGDGLYTTHRVERANGWIKRVMAKADCRLLKTVDAVYERMQAAVADYDAGYGQIPPAKMRELTSAVPEFLLGPQTILSFARSRGYREPTVRGIDFYGENTAENPFVFLVQETPRPAGAGRMTRFAAARRPGFYWSATDASEET